MPSVVRSARFQNDTALYMSGLVVKNQAHFIAAREKDLLPDLKVMLFATIALSSSVLNGVYLLPWVMKSQWISSARTLMLCLRQSSP